MFQSARIKLTLWYLLIIMTISISFSAVIFEVTSHEIDRVVAAQRFRLERRMQSGDVFFSPSPDGPPVPLSQVLFDDELVNDIKRRFVIFLGTINFAIFALSGGLAYFLAGKTLRPIKVMVDEQHRFIADASHELKTPLTALKSAMEVHLRDPKLSIKQARELIADNIQEVNSLQHLSESLLTLTQFEDSTTKNFPVSKVSLDESLSAAVKKMERLSHQADVKIKVSPFSPIEILGNTYVLEELFTILLDNAIKYSKPGKTVRVEVSKSEKSVKVSIQDQGIGIDKKDLPFIFDRFFRADKARTHQQNGGHGLGLSIAQKIVVAHHGTIKVTSTVNKGSIFTVVLPVR